MCIIFCYCNYDNFCEMNLKSTVLLPPFSRYLCSVSISLAFFKSLIALRTVAGDSFMSPAIVFIEGQYLSFKLPEFGCVGKIHIDHSFQIFLQIKKATVLFKKLKRLQNKKEPTLYFYKIDSAKTILNFIIGKRFNTNT